MHTNVKALALGVVWAILGSGAARAQPLPFPIPQKLDPLLVNLVSQPGWDPATYGTWSPVTEWPLNPIHASLMPDGRVVTYGSPPYENRAEGKHFDVWNPRRGFGWESHRILENMPTLNSFCAASTLITTGELLTSGGTPADGGDPKGVSRVNPARTSVGSNPFLLNERYYATQTVLPNGRVLVTGGSKSAAPTWGYNNPADPTNAWNVTTTPEVYTVGGGWQNLTNARHFQPTDPDSALPFGAYDNRWWYPRQWVAPNGLVFGYSTNQMWAINPVVGTITNLGNLSADTIPKDVAPNYPSHLPTNPRPNIGATSTAVMFDVGKILQIGGNGYANGYLSLSATWSSSLATVIDINSGTPAFPGGGGQMARGRQWANSTVLPNGRVLVTGGTEFGNSEASGNPVREPQIWDPVAGWFSPGPPANQPRVYHSTSLLLPNGAVLTGGGGGVIDYPTHRNVEVYYPPYLFAPGGGLAARPRVLSMNARKFSHGGPIKAEVDDSISKAALIGLGSVTHGFDMGQRFIPVTFSVSGSRIEFNAPGDTIAPPGYYLLFVTNWNGVPSRGVIVAIGADVAPPPTSPTPLDYDGDGKSEPAFYRPSHGGFAWLNSTIGLEASALLPPVAGDVPLSGDYDGDGQADPAIFRASTGDYHYASSLNNYAVVNRPFTYPNGGDIPLAGDYNGDGKTEPAFYRPHTGGFAWLDPAIGLDSRMFLTPVAGDIPLAGDYDGDGKTDPAIFRASTGDYHYASSANNYTVVGVPFTYPNGGDIPLVGDYDGDGKAEPAFYRPSNGYFAWRNAAIGLESRPLLTPVAGDIPLAGDYDGDGKTDPAIFRYSTGAWHYASSANGYIVVNVPFTYPSGGDIALGMPIP
jgi:hypothetical protein